MKKIFLLFIFLFSFPLMASAFDFSGQDIYYSCSDNTFYSFPDPSSPTGLPSDATLLTLSAYTALITAESTGSTISCVGGNPTALALPAVVAPSGTGCSATGAWFNVVSPNVIMGGFTSGVTGTCTYTVNAGSLSSNISKTWNCLAIDTTTPKNSSGIQQISTNSTTSCTFSGTTVSGDNIAITMPGS